MTYQKLIYHLGIFILLLSACSNQADREDQDTSRLYSSSTGLCRPEPVVYTRKQPGGARCGCVLHRLYLGEGLDDSRRQHLPLCRRV